MLRRTQKLLVFRIAGCAVFIFAASFIRFSSSSKIKASRKAAIRGSTTARASRKAAVLDQKATTDKPHLTYVVCNGLTNQLLGHAGYIAAAIELGQDILIPDAFIMNGVQNEAKPGSSVLTDVLSTRDNSMPLSRVIDMNSLLDKIRSYGINADVEPYDTALKRYKDEPESCNWLETLSQSKHQTANEILQAIKPSKTFSELIGTNLSNLKTHIRSSDGDLSDGICLHHRDGEDWHKHCKQWEGIRDGVWRKNCLNDQNLPLHELVQLRIPEKYPKSWIYYIGDSEPSDETILNFKRIGMDVFHRKKDELLHDADISRALGLEEVSLVTHRDLLAAIDFFTCSKIDNFIGNSVSSFSATQIAMRGGMNSTWYNSRSIPMANVFHAFNVPIIYTYTEESSISGRHLLKASILSVRGAFGMSTDIHILYHGTKDDAFQQWLRNHKVIIHHHEPKWLDVVESMRQHGDARSSHLFSNQGNYIGTWQRIDIPLFIDAEYCMLLDSDTIVHSAFGMHDFGLAITQSLAVSQEADEKEAIPWNLGVALLNVPHLRKTYDDFMNHIQSHAEDPMFGPNLVSDQGAYLSYYKETIQFLDWTFNVKPYWKKQSSFDNRKIVHFHGMKPHDILKLWMGYPIDYFSPALKDLIVDYLQRNPANQCLVMHDFSRYLSADENLNDFCSYNFKDDGKNKVELCKEFFTAFANGKEEVGEMKPCQQKFRRIRRWKRWLIFGIICWIVLHSKRAAVLKMWPKLVLIRKVEESKNWLKFKHRKCN